MNQQLEKKNQRSTTTSGWKLIRAHGKNGPGARLYGCSLMCVINDILRMPFDKKKEIISISTTDSLRLKITQSVLK